MPPIEATTPSERLALVRAAIARAAGLAGRPAAAVELIAISKTHDAAAIQPLIDAGQRVFGENRVQEAEAKWPALKVATPDIRLHLVGQLQSNKAAQAIALFDAIHSVDRISLADALVRAIDKAGTAPACFVQVNIGEEEQKGGCAIDALPALLDHCRAIGLPIAGLMCVPPLETEAAPYFALLAKLARDHGLAGLSMGMSGDYETAVMLGATHVRVGTALFGGAVMKFDAILFDFDGVLIESEHVGNIQLGEYLTRIGHPTSAEQSMAMFMGLAGLDFLAAVETWIGRPLPDDFHEDRAAGAAQAMAEGLPAVAGAVAFVRGLPEALPIAVVSSSSTIWIRAHLAHLGLTERFGDHVYSGREHVERGKPAPDLYLYGAAQLGVDITRTAILEDSPVGATGAVASGAFVIGLCAGSHCGAGHDAVLRGKGVQVVADSFDAVQRIVSASPATN